MNSTRINTLSNVAASAEDNGMNDLIPGTNLTWAEGSAMAKDHARDQRIENLGKSRRRSSARRTAPAVGLEESIGWGDGALVDFIAENQREERLFGKTQLYVD